MRSATCASACSAWTRPERRSRSARSPTLRRRGRRLELLVRLAQALAEVLDELEQHLWVLVDDRMQPVTTEHAHRRVDARLGARGARLLVENRHLPHHAAASVAGESHLTPVAVEVDADLAVDH